MSSIYRESKNVSINSVKYNYKNIKKHENKRKRKIIFFLSWNLSASINVLEMNKSVIFILIYLFAHLLNNLPEK